MRAIEAEPIAAALIASGRCAFRYTERFSEPRGIFCVIEGCTDCLMEVNSRPNVRCCGNRRSLNRDGGRTNCGGFDGPGAGTS